jgi:hypothetical protein
MKARIARLVAAIAIPVVGLLLAGCATMNTDQGKNIKTVAVKNLDQETDFPTLLIEGTNVEFTIKNANKIAFRSYKPPIPAVPSKSWMDGAWDTLKWVAGFYFMGNMFEAASAKTIVPTQVVEQQVLVPIEGAAAP